MGLCAEPPHIVTVHEVAEENRVGFIVMEYVTGKTLDSVIPSKGFPVRQALEYALQMADALSTAQAAGILHGDLKPLNVMVTPNGQVKLLDFGLVQKRLRPGSANRRRRRRGRDSEQRRTWLPSDWKTSDLILIALRHFSFGLICTRY